MSCPYKAAKNRDISKEELMKEICNYLDNGKSQERMLLHLRKKYGFFKFRDLGFGNYETFLEKNKNLYDEFTIDAKQSRLESVKSLPIDVEDSIVIMIKEHLKQNPENPRIMNYLKRQFGIKKFLDLNVGPYNEFLEKHKLHKFELEDKV